MIEQDIPPCFISIDKEGRWFHKGAEMINREIVRHFYENLTIDSLGRYVIHWGNERCLLEVEDTPFVVRRVVFREEGGGRNARFILFLSDDTQETLAPDTLYVGRDDVLYCRVKQGRFPGRFQRPAYYQLAEYIGEEDGEFFLPLKERKYPIRREGASPSPFFPLKRF